MNQYDIAILGAGPGGYVAAIRAAQLRAKVCVIEKEYLGGTCLNVGCIPSKAMFKSTELFSEIKAAEAYGLEVNDFKAHLDKIVDRKDKIVVGLRNGIAALFKHHKIDLVEGFGKLKSPNEIEVKTNAGETTVISAEKIILATGSIPVPLDMAPLDHDKVIDTTDALALRKIPESLFIVGGGVSGCEFACIYAALGTKITITKRRPTPVTGLDDDLANALVRSLKKKKCTLHLGDQLDTFEVGENGISATLKSGKKVEAEKALITIGRQSYSKDMGFEEVGVEMDSKGLIVIDEHCKTNLPNVYAIGDVTGKKWLAHSASAQGMVAVKHALGDADAVMDYNAVPNVIFTSPEVASVGLTKQEAEEQNIETKVGMFNFRSIGKSHAIGHIDGFVKIMADAKTNKVIGVHIIGHGAASMIAEATLALSLGATADQIAHTIHAHPTMPEAIQEAAEDVFGMAIHHIGK